MPRPIDNKGTYLPALDGLRALAVAAVVAYHLGSDAVPGGLLGVGIFFTLNQIVPRGLATRDHCFEKKVALFFDKWHQVGIVVARHDEHTLSWILRLVGMSQDVEKPARLNGDHDAFK